MKQLTLREPASITGFSVNTVSRALNDRRGVNPKTKEKILAVANRLGYRPNRLAKGLRSSKTQTIGVIVSDIANPFFGAVVKGIQDEARKSNYSIILQGSDEEYDKEADAIQVMLAEQVEGLLITPVQTEHETIDRLTESGFPFVLLARRFDDLEADYVVPDNVRGGFLATEHLILLGHRRIAFVNAPTCISSARNRMIGYERALAEHGIAVDRSLVSCEALTAQQGYVAAKALLQGRPLPTAVFTYSDFVAFGVMRAIREAGLRVPEDMSVIGFDDIELASCVDVPLTTIRSPKEELGREAVDVLTRRLSGANEVGRVTMPVDLVVRESTRSRGATQMRAQRKDLAPDDMRAKRTRPREQRG